jgi:hypothetical protein
MGELTHEPDEPRDPEQRADNIADEHLPEDNPFAELVRELRESGESWREVFDKMEAAYNPVDKAAFEASSEYLPEWEVTGVDYDKDATNGEKYVRDTFTAKTPAEAEDRMNRKVLRVESEKTEHVGWAKVV